MEPVDDAPYLPDRSRALRRECRRTRRSAPAEDLALARRTGESGPAGDAVWSTSTHLRSHRRLRIVPRLHGSSQPPGCAELPPCACAGPRDSAAIFECTPDALDAVWTSTGAVQPSPTTLAARFTGHRSSETATHPRGLCESGAHDGAQHRRLGAVADRMICARLRLASSAPTGQSALRLGLVAAVALWGRGTVVMPGPGGDALGALELVICVHILDCLVGTGRS